jgi:predicted phosphodiesterase
MKHKGLLISAILLFSIYPFTNLKPEDKPQENFIIWSHSDIQPKEKDHLTNFPLAVDDIAANFDYIDIAITAGDIVEKKNSADLYKSYLETRKKIKAGGWFEIAGNHEAKDIETYKKLINPHLHYSVKAGNILIIFMSNSEKGQQTVIPDKIFEWWKNKVISNQDKLIITVTHASLKNSGLLQSKIGLKRQFIKDSKRFEKVLKKYKVDLWISGHSHLPGYLPYTDYKNETLGGTVFIDNGAIRKDFMAGIESRLIYFLPGTDRLIIRHRDHADGKFSDSREKLYKLSKAFHYSKGDKIILDETAD